MKKLTKILSLLLVISCMLSCLAGCGAGKVSPAVEEPQKAKYIDLHQHLDGAITVDIAKKLAELQGIELPAKDDAELKKLLTVSPDCKSLTEFLECFALPGTLMQTPEGLSEAVYLVMENCKASGDIYVEIRFAPQLHCDKGMSQEDAIKAALDGLKRSDLRGNLILCCMRGEGNDDKNMETIELAKKYLVEDGGVVAVDLAGAEALFPTVNYRQTFAKAKEYNIPFTLHAGEADGPESVRLAIEYGASRIGHGVRIYEDPEVMELVRSKGIYLEMCPTSNSQTCAIEDMSGYPLKDYMNYGIKVTLNTDDPAIEGTDIGTEYAYIKDNFGLSESEKLALLANAVDAAFTSYEVKNQLREELGLPYIPEETAAAVEASAKPASEPADLFSEKHLVIIDTDTAGDDAMAMAMAAKAPNLDILGVTVLPGNVSLEQGAQNALMTLEVAGRSDIPVYCGPDMTYDGSIRSCFSVFGSDGMGDEDLIHPTGKPEEMDAVDFIIESVKEHPDEVEILAIGPATNIALAIDRDPETMSHVKHIWSMGTAGFGPGNATPVAEFNVFHDAKAYEVMLKSNIPMTIIGLDMTHLDDVLITEDQMAQLLGKGDLLHFLSTSWNALLDFKIKNNSQHYVDICDAIAAYVLIYSDAIVESRLCAAVCSSNDSADYGQVIFYRTDIAYDSMPDIGEANKEVLTVLNSAPFYDRCVDLLDD